MNWVRSSFCNGGNCAEAAWVKASASIGNGACAEFGTTGGMVAMRDSKDPEGPVLRFTAAQWRAFLDGAKRGEFDDLA